MLSRIIVIDDSADDVFVLRDAFRKAGFDDPVLHLSDVDVAMAYLEGTGVYADRTKHPLPSVLLLDLKMPQKHGLDLLVWIRRQPHLARIFVVILTGTHDASVIQRAYELGANSYLAKDAANEEVRVFVQFLRTLSIWWERLPHSAQNSMSGAEPQRGSTSAA